MIEGISLKIPAAPETIQFIDVDNSIYFRIYENLMNIRTTLESMSKQLLLMKTTFSLSKKQSQEKIETLIMLVQKLIDSDFKSVFSVAAEILPNVQKLICGSSDECQEMITKLLTIVINLSKSFSLISCNMDRQENTRVQHNSKQITNQINQQIIEEKQKNQIRQHIQNLRNMKKQNQPIQQSSISPHTLRETQIITEHPIQIQIPSVKQTKLSNPLNLNAIKSALMHSNNSLMKNSNRCAIARRIVTSVIEKEEMPDDNKESDSQEKPEDSEEGLVLCRICEKYIPISELETHSENCVVAYESEYKIVTTDEKIKRLNRAINMNILSTSWPGNKNETIESILPMLHLTTLLDVAINNHEKGILQKIYHNISTVKCNKYDGFIAKAKEFIFEKLQAASQFNEAVNKGLLRIDPGTIPLSTTLADFEFIKPISSGAYARVFLARKKKTQDIYAVKITPKSSLKQKNQVRRAITEKDILLMNTNPYIINLCMFL